MWLSVLTVVCSSAECAQGEFMCDITRCIPKSSLCDEKTDCVDGTDELNCPDTEGESTFLFLGE